MRPVLQRLPEPARRLRAGLTLIELVLAAGLLSMLTLALLQLLDTCLEILRRTDARRDQVEMASAIGQLLRDDLAALENGPRGDLLAEWTLRDGDQDGLSGGLYPRLRFVRRASSAEISRHHAGQQEAQRGEGLMEVAWTLAPRVVTSPERSVERVLWRGERVIGDSSRDTLFSDGLFSGGSGTGALEEVTGGVLWFGMGFATQTSILWDGWSYGESLQDGTHSWDAWSRERPDREVHSWNDPGAGIPVADEHPVLPRRVRFELTLERPVDRKRRTRLVDRLEDDEVLFSVGNRARLPKEDDYLLIDEEWMRVRSISGRRVNVERGMRGSRTLAHPAGALIQYGPTVVVEVPVRLYREDWNL